MTVTARYRCRVGEVQRPFDNLNLEVILLNESFCETEENQLLENLKRHFFTFDNLRKA